MSINENTIPDIAPEDLNIELLAEELGVDRSFYKYKDSDRIQAVAVFEFFLQSLQPGTEDVEEHVVISGQDLASISSFLGSIENLPCLPLFLPKMKGENITLWQKHLFFDLIIVYIICRGMEMRRDLLKNLKEENAFENSPREMIPRINDVELFNTFGAIFLERTKSMLHQQPIFHSIRAESMSLEDWYDEQLKIADRKVVPRRILETADKRFWVDPQIPITKLFVTNRSITQMDPREFVCYIDRFLCHAGYEYFDLISGGIISDRSGYIPRWCAWLKSRRKLILDSDTQAQKVFRRVFRVEGALIEENKLSQEAIEKLPGKIQDVFSELFLSLERVRQKTRNSITRMTDSNGSSTERVSPVGEKIDDKKITIPTLNKSSIFIRGGDREQLAQLDLSTCNFPEGTQFVFEREWPRMRTEDIPLTDVHGINIIAPNEGKKYRGHVTYRLKVTLPTNTNHVFENQRKALTLEEKWYAEAPWTQSEKDAEEVLQKASKKKEEPVASVVESTSAIVEAVTQYDPIGISLTCVALTLDAKKEQFKEQPGYEKGPVVITLSDDDLRGTLGDDDVSKVLPEHMSWTIAENDTITPMVTDKDVNSTLLEIAQSIRQSAQDRRIVAEQQKREEAEKIIITAIDTEFIGLGFTPSPAIEVDTLRDELSQKIKAIQQKKGDMRDHWESEIKRIGTELRGKGYHFYHANHIGGFPASITLSKDKSWSATLVLQPRLELQLRNLPSQEPTLFRKRLENALMTFAYDMLKNGTHSLESLVHDTLAREDMGKLKRHYKRELREKRARLLVQPKTGPMVVVSGISRDSLEVTLRELKEQHGKDNVALLLRQDTYHFYGEHGIIRPKPERVLATYDEFDHNEIGKERRGIIRARIMSTFFNGSGRSGRDPFIVGSGVDTILTGIRRELEQGERKIADHDIDDMFITRFIDALKGGESPVPVSYIPHRVAYCRPENVRELIAD